MVLKWAMGTVVPDLMSATLKWLRIGEVMGLTTPRPSQKHVIAAEVFLITDSGHVEESASKHRKSTTVDTFIEQIETPRSLQNVAKCCSC